MQNKNNTMILVKSLTKRFNNNRHPIIEGLNLKIQRGEMAILLGRSGCGKTTLLNLIAGLDRPNSGKIFIDGTRIDQLSEDKLAKFRLLNVGFVFQDYNLITELTILENVAIPLKLAGEKNMKRARKLLKIFDISDLADEKANTVSGGEAQRAAIARAMANKPKVLLADEPTGNLDEENEINVMKYFKKAQKQFETTLIVATHNKTLSEFGTRIFNFENLHHRKSMTNIRR